MVYICTAGYAHMRALDNIQGRRVEIAGLLGIRSKWL